MINATIDPSGADTRYRFEWGPTAAYGNTIPVPDFKVVNNHAPAQIFMNTGSVQFGRPSMGAWTTYGLGSESRDLPAYVVFSSGSKGTWPSGPCARRVSNRERSNQP